MRKLFSKEVIYTTLQKHKKRLKWQSLLLAMFVFCVNIYAWFTYFSKAEVLVDVNVSSWDIQFYDDNRLVNDFVVDIVDVYPGMDTYTKELTVTNSSDMGAEFSYVIETVTMNGVNVLPLEYNLEQSVDYLKNFYPFEINFSNNKELLERGESLKFGVTVDWPYESLETTYFRLNSQYTYDSNFTYYTFDGNNYLKREVTEDEYNSLKNDLYLEKDDADTFFGEKCSDCFQVKLKLIVEQVEK